MTYVAFLVIIRPFKGVCDNLMEIMNELFLLASLCILLALNTQEKWTESRVKMFMNFLMVNSILAVVIVTCKYPCQVYFYLPNACLHIISFEISLVYD